MERPLSRSPCLRGEDQGERPGDAARTFTADWQANRAAWETRMGATVAIRAGRRHFNGAEEPDVARAIAGCVAALRPAG